ncbi:Rieske iron-sulfur domain protein [Halosimplex carlsbadense 2-9-1]|uniref:Rieske iron-sulfur domain protein n=1 Tax=Halosimplex carlsbadense 2-9-1 TaxID=797114 RepID=M0CYV3_9EURY|nr:Rieske 2Fe-2S domain-containing protein [Halosimplex carlsbadense]ELZ27602.1 Rieske iron-sulfur domain protein [Halosimplex carlsbadense 2-9-1]
MDGTRIADVSDLSTDDTFLFRVRSVDENAVASGDAALRSDERTADAADERAADDTDPATETDGGETSATNDDGIAMPDDMQDDDDDVREAILLQLGGEDDDAEAVVGWLNYCQHMTHIKLDKGSGAPVRDSEVICVNHGALFAADSGECTYGPCEGAFLNEIDVRVADDGVYLADEDFEYVGEGPVESDDDDLSSSSNVIL